MKALFFFFFLCLILVSPIYSQRTSEGCLTGYIRYYSDSDGDGYGTGMGTCSTSQPLNSSLLGGDCDDTNPAVHPHTIWYYDGDGDGLGDPGTIKRQCFQPLYYVGNNNDICPLDPGPAPTGCPESSGGNITFSDMNYVHTVNFKKPYTSAPASPTTDDVLQEITYMDGLGRPIQNIKINQAVEGAAMEDLITEITYDSYGRSVKDYLPYAEATATPGAYQPLDLTEGRDFYWGKFPADFTSQTATNSYSEKSLEASPLSRVLKQAAPGSSWKMGSGHEIEFDYQANVSGTSTGKVRHYKVNLPTGYSNPTISTPGFYAAGELYKNVTRDENHSIGLNHTTEEFTNKKGQVVLKRTYSDIDLNNDGDTLDTGEQQVTHDTYYVYDDYGNLTFVLPPLTNSTDALPTQTELIELCYQYKYDGKNRLIEKKIPGKGWEYIVYNPLDQPILTKDANLSGKWLYTKYDAFGRVITTGFHSHSASTQSAMQTVVNNHYSGTTKAWEDHTSTSTNNYYTNRSYPTSSNEVLTLNYYDNYTFDATGQGIKLSSGASFFGGTVDYAVKGLPTGNKVKILDQATTNWITTVTHYDAQGRLIYTGSYNDLLLVKETKKHQLEPITGNVLKTETYHKKGSLTAISLVDEFTYDDLNRLERHTQAINGNTKELIAENVYDKLGQLKSKGVGNIATSINRLQDVDYTYNVRGWLKGINNAGGSNSIIGLGTNDLFGFQINYDKPTDLTKALFNGNISQTLWKSKSADQNQRSYLYLYDNLNRLKSAISNDGKFDVGSSTNPIAYDKNGNIKKMYRKGAIVASPVYSTASHFGVMDNMTYTYDSGNKLRAVNDIGNTTYGFKDASTLTTQYTYDLNGNLISDANKGIAAGGIEYNHLNMPTKITVSNAGSNNGIIDYVYAADGIKLQKKKTQGGVTTTTDYAGNYMYKNGTLQFFNHPEGYVENNAGTYKYHYQYKDHLGNIRLSYFNNGTITSQGLVISEENNYYPFGLEHNGYNNVVNDSENKHFNYNGQELDENLGLNVLEMTFRQYDPALGRFYVIDELAEQATDFTPYRFGFNNPILFSDPTGLWEQVNGGYTTTDEDEIARMFGYINQKGSDVSNQGLQNFIKEDIAFFEGPGGYNSGLLLSTAIVENGKITDHSVHRMKNEIAYYMGTTDYLYTREDYEMRNSILTGSSDPISKELLRRESIGWYQPITAKNWSSYVGYRDSAQMLSFASFMESVDGPSLKVKLRSNGSIVRIARYSPTARVAKRLGFDSGSVPDNIKYMSFREFHMKFSGKYKGKYKGRGSYMKFMAMDYKAIKSGF